MFYEALIPILKADVVLKELVGTFASSPSIFSEFAPDDAKTPYIVVNIDQQSNRDVTIELFEVNVDFYDYNKSSKDSREFAERIEYLLDHTKIDSNRYGAIRFFKYDGGPVREDDPRAIHHNMQFQVRAGRKAWGEHNITTIGE